MSCKTERKWRLYLFVSKIVLAHLETKLWLEWREKARKSWKIRWNWERNQFLTEWSESHCFAESLLSFQLCVICLARLTAHLNSRLCVLLREEESKFLSHSVAATAHYDISSCVLQQIIQKPIFYAFYPTLRIRHTWVIYSQFMYFTWAKLFLGNSIRKTLHIQVIIKLIFLPRLRTYNNGRKWARLSIVADMYSKSQFVQIACRQTDNNRGRNNSDLNIFEIKINIKGIKVLCKDLCLVMWMKQIKLWKFPCVE